jgi:predicted RNase H-like HicB family nuclease
LVATRAEGYITLTFKLHVEDGQYVARCVELGVSSCAKGIEKAIERIEEATSLYLNTLEDVGERERVLKEAGIEIKPGVPTPHDVPVCARTDKEIVTARTARLPGFVFV